MKIALCGSMEFADGMNETADTLETMGYETYRPAPADEGRIARDPATKGRVMREYFEFIDQSDAVLLYNVAKKGIAGYIGGNTLLEASHAFSRNVPIFAWQPLPDMDYAVEIAAMRPRVLNGRLDGVNDYFDSLPRMHVSSKSPVKLQALSAAMRRAGRPVVPVGYKTQSGVNEQPMTIEETLQGATNRHAHLHTFVEAGAGDYFATIESGNQAFTAALGFRGLSVTIIEQQGYAPQHGLDVDIEFPAEFAALVPSQYPDYGVLMQQKFGSELKDPYPYLTGGKLTRAELLEEAAYRVATQL